MLNVMLYIVAAATGLCLAASAQAQNWTIPPAYSSPPAKSELSFQDEQGRDITLYDESYAVLILQGNYDANNGWSSPAESARVVEKRLTAALIERHFNVLVWRDLGSDALRTVAREAFSRLGRGGNARLFFFYFGHGTMVTSASTGKQFFLVPVDAPSLSNEQDFVEKALSDLELRSDFNNTRAKHTFLAFEACESGGILAGLGQLPPANKLYLTSKAVQERSIQFLTAGNARDSIPADGGFSELLIESLSSYAADGRGDKYITASDVMHYVSTNLQNRSRGIYTSKPEYRTIPSGGGDFIFGPVRRGQSSALAASATTSDADESSYRLSPSGQRVIKVGKSWKMISADNQLAVELKLQTSVPDSPDYEFWLQGVDMMFRIPKLGGPVKRKPSGEQLWSEYGTATR